MQGGIRPDPKAVYIIRKIVYCNMKKKVMVAALIMAVMLPGCSASELKKGMDNTNELMGNAADAARDLALEASDVPVDDIKETVKEAGKEAFSTVTESLAGAAKEAAKDAASEMISKADIELENTDGKGKNYHFYYAGEDFTAIYTDDNWKILDSYRVNSESDMVIICQALIDEHPVHGKDLVSFRTAEDMAYEWQIHNIAYSMIKDDDTLKNKAKDVDFDPKDQGLTLEEFYESRTGKKLDLGDIMDGLTTP